MKPTQMTRKGLLPQSLKALLAVGFLGIAVSTQATPLQGFICLSDNNGSPGVTYSTLSGITSPTTDTPNITSSTGEVQAQLYVESAGVGGYFFAPFTSYTILSQLGVPQFVVEYNVTTTGLTQDSLTLTFVDSLSANFSTLLGLATTAGSPNVALTGGQQNISDDLEPVSGDESHGALAICVQCSAPAPDTTPTWPLLGLAMIGLASMYRFMPGFAKGSR